MRDEGFYNNIDLKIYKISSEPYKPHTDTNILVDSGASVTILNNKTLFTEFDQNFNPKNTFIEMADGSRKTNIVVARGNASIHLFDINGISRSIKVHNALLIPSFSKNILSVAEAIKQNFKFNFNREGFETMVCPQGNIFHITKLNNIYTLNSIVAQSIIARTPQSWHKMFGHISIDNIKRLEPHITNMKIQKSKKETFCEPCIMAKFPRDFSRVLDSRSQTKFNQLYMDLSGPVHPTTDYNYLLALVDDYSSYIACYTLCNKSQVAEALQQFIADYSPYGSRDIKIIRSDSGKEFLNKQVMDIMRNRMIQFQTCAPYSPHQNGRAERSWKSIYYIFRSILFDSNCPHFLWPYIAKYAVYLKNRSFNEHINKTPYEAITGKKPLASDIRLFGSLCYGYQHYVTHLRKFDPRALPAVFIGFDKLSPAKLLFYPQDNKIRRIRCVKFTDQYYYSGNNQHASPFEDDGSNPFEDDGSNPDLLHPS